MVPCGSRTSLSDGAPPFADAVLFGMSKFNRVIEVSYDYRFAVVRSEVTNIAATRTIEERGFNYGPDPSGRTACSLGGNVAENS